MNDSQKTDDMKERLTDSLMENLNQHANVLTNKLEENSKQHTEMLPEEEEVLKPCNFNTDDSCVNYAGKGGQQMENVREFNKRETMLDENIVEDHHSIMVIGTMEITLEAGKKDNGDFMSLERDLEMQEKDLVIGSSNETIGSCNFGIDNLIVFIGIAEDNPSFGNVLKEEDTVMFHMQKLVTIDDKEELAFLNNKENDVG